MSVIKVLIPMSDYGHDPTETAVAFAAFKEARFEVQFATENGNTPACDKKLLEGFTQKLLGASKPTLEAYKDMCNTSEFKNPLSWSSPDFTLETYNLVYIPGGHDKGVRQLLDSAIIRTHLATYFPMTRKPSTRSVSAVCHGVQVLAEAEASDGKSILHKCTTTSLPTKFEQLAYWSTKVFMGDYYKTYGSGSANVEEVVRKRLENPDKQFKSSLIPKPFVVQDDTYNYLSARFPGDVQLLAEETIALVQSTMS
ncbi:Class I glutamine amidotransferase-like protein [Venustampulla echinocandica]|uniref:Class I glutamine amidotransferase-like protein n=1 Tax=Venustampulla echinocandica TaxID=2656787 RepID=A0A370THV5_9HELO|nr:Class I glutamine amidotransferase-like protein [Venustampulla echinocandica]RDL34779.1 Class I glutamine amidotransferase-like protein [Venustampulla echinocandica]